MTALAAGCLLTIPCPGLAAGRAGLCFLGLSSCLPVAPNCRSHSQPPAKTGTLRHCAHSLCNLLTTCPEILENLMFHPSCSLVGLKSTLAGSFRAAVCGVNSNRSMHAAKACSAQLSNRLPLQQQQKHASCQGLQCPAKQPSSAYPVQLQLQAVSMAKTDSGRSGFTAESNGMGLTFGSTTPAALTGAKAASCDLAAQKFMRAAAKPSRPASVAVAGCGSGLVASWVWRER